MSQRRRRNKGVVGQRLQERQQLIAIRVAWLPKHFDPLGSIDFYRPRATFLDGISGFGALTV
jgi:hypothetical protein